MYIGGMTEMQMGVMNKIAWSSDCWKEFVDNCAASMIDKEVLGMKGVQ